MNGIIAAYRPGNTWLYRISAGPKLALVALCSITIAVTPGWRAGVAGLVIAIGVLISSRTLFAPTMRSARSLLTMLVLVAAFQTWQRGWQLAVAVTCDLLALFLIAYAFTATTAVDGLLTAIERGLRPLRRFGARPDRVALAFSLALSTIGRLLDLAGETRNAARARGLERNLRALLIPFAIRSVAHAIDIGAALHARGIGDDPPEPADSKTPS